MNLGDWIFEVGGLVVILVMFIVLGVIWYHYHKKREDEVPRLLLVTITFITCLTFTFLAFLSFENVASTLKIGVIITVVGTMFVFLHGTLIMKLEKIRKRKQGIGK